MLPAQQGCPRVPQALQVMAPPVPAVQAVPMLQVLLAQQGCPIIPQPAQRPAAQITVAPGQELPAQHA